MASIAAGVVLFNPEDQQRFLESIESVLKQFPKVYIFDNSTKRVDLPNLPESAVYITEHANRGIAYALNRLMQHAENDGFDWLVTMDQDSVLPPNIEKAYEKHFHDKDVAIICPQVVDSRRAYMEVKHEPAQEYIDDCITSGSCTSIAAWKKVGGFDDWLFIDLVDNEFCKRIIAAGYKILRLNDVVMNQEFGTIIPKSKRVQDFWVGLSKKLNKPNIGKLSYKKTVSPLRVYYTNRNIIYVNRKLKKYGSVGYQNYHCRGYLGFWIAFNIPSVLRAQDKKAVIKSIVKGVQDGKASKPQPWSAPSTN